MCVCVCVCMEGVMVCACDGDGQVSCEVRRVQDGVCVWGAVIRCV